jgi:hypothetical protein
MAILTICLASSTIILVAGGEGSGGSRGGAQAVDSGVDDNIEKDGGYYYHREYREALGILQEIQALVGRDELEMPESPYAKALEWILHHDPMQLVPTRSSIGSGGGVDDDDDSNNNNNNSHLVQRCIMTYLYYATTANGPWSTCNPPVVDSQESEFCYFEDDMPNTRWLSSVHECYFAGVACNDQMQVIRLELGKSATMSMYDVYAGSAVYRSLQKKWTHAKTPAFVRPVVL